MAMSSESSESPITILNEDTLVTSSLFNSNVAPKITVDKRSSTSISCRICHEDSSNEELIDPCECSGTLALIHASCLEKWLSASNTERCEICKHEFYVQRKDKSIFKSIWQWWKSRKVHGARNIAGDTICLVVLTPLCFVTTYLCGIGALAYTRLGFWEGTGLGVLCCLLVATYCLWLVVTVRFHYKSWHDWHVRNQEIKLLVKHLSDEDKKSFRAMREKFMKSQNEERNNSRSMYSYETAPRMINRSTSWFEFSSNPVNDPVFFVHNSSVV